MINFKELQLLSYLFQFSYQISLRPREYILRVQVDDNREEVQNQRKSNQSEGHERQSSPLRHFDVFVQQIEHSERSANTY